MVAPAGPQEFGVVSAEFDAPGPRVVEQGTVESTQYTLGNGGFVPVVAFFDSTTDGIAVEPDEAVIPARSSANATLTVTAPPEPGYYRYFVVEHRYLLLLPQSTIRSLYHIHPWLPIITIDALLGGSFYLLGMALVDTGRVRSRSRDSPSQFRRLLARLR
jgi:signal peptidase